MNWMAIIMAAMAGLVWQAGGVAFVPMLCLLSGVAAAYHFQDASSKRVAPKCVVCGKPTAPRDLYYCAKCIPLSD